jgi:hypothetical protein
MGQEISGPVVDGDGSLQMIVASAATAESNGLNLSLCRSLNTLNGIADHDGLIGPRIGANIKHSFSAPYTI